MCDIWPLLGKILFHGVSLLLSRKLMSPRALFERVFSLSEKFAAELVQEAVEHVRALLNWRVQYCIFSAGALNRAQTPGAKFMIVSQLYGYVYFYPF